MAIIAAVNIQFCIFYWNDLLILIILIILLMFILINIRISSKCSRIPAENQIMWNNLFCVHKVQLQIDDDDDDDGDDDDDIILPFSLVGMRI